MKKLVNVLSIIYLLLLYYLLSPDNKLLLTMNFGIYILIKSIFSTTKYTSNKNKKLLIYTILTLLLGGLLLSGISYILGNIVNIKYLNITNTLVIFYLISQIIIKLISEYYNNNKINYIPNIFILLLNIILIIILKNKYNMLYLYISQIIITLIISILSLTLSKKQKNNINIKEIKNIIINNKEEVIINILKSSYIYTSIIILYYILINKYINPNTNIILSNTYFFGIILINILYKIIEKYIKIDNNINKTINNTLNTSLTICIPLMIISYPLSKVIFNSSTNIIFPLIILLFFYIMYNIVLKISINNISDKKINIILLLGLIIKLISEIPLINSIYRMGYDLSLGSILSTSLGLIIITIISIILITKKQKTNLLDNFNNILNIIYTNIIYLLILVLFTLIIKVDNPKYYINILVIVFYIFISIIFNIIKKNYQLLTLT